MGIKFPVIKKKIEPLISNMKESSLEDAITDLRKCIRTLNENGLKVGIKESKEYYSYPPCSLLKDILKEEYEK